MLILNIFLRWTNTFGQCDNLGNFAISGDFDFVGEYYTESSDKWEINKTININNKHNYEILCKLSESSLLQLNEAKIATILTC